MTRHLLYISQVCLAASCSFVTVVSAWDTNDWEFLESIQQANFRFFRNEKKGPYNLLNDTAAYNSTNNHPPISSVAGTGFELTAIPIGHYRGWISYAEAYEQVLHMLKAFNHQLSADPEVLKRENGWTYHWYRIDNGYEQSPDGLSLLDHSIFIAGCIFASEYFKGTEAAALAHQLYAETQWDLRPDSDYTGFGYSENLLSIIEAAEAPQYKKGPQAKTMWNSLVVPFPRTLQLYFWQYPHAWVDFRFRTDDNGFNHADVARDSILYQRQRAIELNQGDPATYDTLGSNSWGWTAASTSEGYRQMAPWDLWLDGTYYPTERACDSGSITPFALPPCMVYAPTETMAAMKHLFELYFINGWNLAEGELPLWSETYGFLNCINKSTPWVSAYSNHYHDVNAAIDYGPNVIGVENYLRGTTWRYFMQNPSISSGMTTLGFTPPNWRTYASFSNAVNEFTGTAGLGSWHNDATPVSASYVATTWSNTWVRDWALHVQGDGPAEGAWLELGGIDARGLAELSFWFKAGTADVALRVGLKDLQGRENKVPLEAFHRGPSLTNWALVQIPLDAFSLTGTVTNDLWLGHLDLVSFEFTNASAGGFDLDYLAFTPDRRPPRAPTNGLGTAQVGLHPRVTWHPEHSEHDVVGMRVWRRFTSTGDFVEATGLVEPKHRNGFTDQAVSGTETDQVRYAVQALDNAEPQGFSPFTDEVLAHLEPYARLDLDWDNGLNPNVLGGNNEGYFGPPGAEAFGFVKTNRPGDGFGWVRRSAVNEPGGGHFVDLGEGDAGDYSAVDLYIRAAGGSPDVALGFRDLGGIEQQRSLAAYLPGGSLNTNWERVLIPLSDFYDVDMTALRNLSLTHATSGTVELAHTGFREDQRGRIGTLWEAEDYDSQVGSSAIDFKPAASGNKVLGADWGIDPLSEAVYTNIVLGLQTSAWFHLWYAIDGGPGCLLDVEIDGRWVARLPCTPTTGWGSRRVHFDRVSVKLGALDPGPHTLRLSVPTGGRAVNLDAFYIGDAPPDLYALDRDGDGLSDRQEILLGTSATQADSDGDGLTDSQELTALGTYGWPTDPTKADTDGDGQSDAEEGLAGFNPLDSTSFFKASAATPSAAASFQIQWPAVSGQVYDVTYCDGPLRDNAVFIPVTDPHHITTAGGTGRYNSLLLATTRTFRVRSRPAP